MLGESRIATAEGPPIFGSNHVHHGMTLRSDRRPLFGTTVKRPVVSPGGSEQIDLFGAKLTASRQTAAGAHEADTDRKAVTAAEYGT
jgi:hypothetical protein